MNTRIFVSLSLSALVLGGTVVGCTANRGTGIAAASDRSQAVATKAAGRNADKAMRALAKRDAVTAVGFAEAAVSLAPRDADYRMMLAQSYMQAGRFLSARASFADVLELTPGNGKAALNLALSQIATGDWADARRTLDAHAATIPVGDVGLARALAGDPAGALALLGPVARSPDSTVKVRQNLALSYALAGHWNMARVVASTDLSPADVDARMAQWAAFAQPKAAPDQVAALLGVTPTADPGQPMALALNGSVPVATENADVQLATVEPDVMPENVAAQTALVAPTLTPTPASIRAASAPTMLIDAPAGPTKVAVTEASGPVSGSVSGLAPGAAPGGNWYVQIGAFSKASSARTGWGHATRQFAALADHHPNGTRFIARQGALYRLSIGGFSRSEADRMCGRYRAKGGACFVRREAGDHMAQWLRTPLQMASR